MALLWLLSVVIAYLVGKDNGDTVGYGRGYSDGLIKGSRGSN